MYQKQALDLVDSRIAQRTRQGYFVQQFQARWRKGRWLQTASRRLVNGYRQDINTIA